MWLCLDAPPAVACPRHGRGCTYFLKLPQSPTRCAPHVPRAFPAFLPPPLLVVDVPVLVEQQQLQQQLPQDTPRDIGEARAQPAASDGRVTIPRRRAESMLVDAYREKLAAMSDVEVSHLFEREVLKEFPGDVILGVRGQEALPSSTSSTAAGAASPSPSSGGSMPGVGNDETASLLRMQGREESSGLTSKPDGNAGLLEKVFGGIQDPKEVAVPVMGAGALVLGVALMYKLISTLSNGGKDGGGSMGPGSEAAREGPRELSRELPRELPPPEQDPYLMYDQQSKSGEVLWQRRDVQDASYARARGGERKTPKGRDLTAEEDPWRAPMPTEGSESPSNRSVGDATASSISGKPSGPKDVLDNAESVRIASNRSRN